ncbi:MAG: putative photosynthetic complex assembly protein PuhE [Pseudomonadota bacterium]
MTAPILFSVFLWWLSTGLIFCAGARGRPTMRWSMALVTLAAIAAVYGLYATRGDTSVTGAYIAFSCALVIWGWHEMTFLFGYITGPSQAACPPGVTGWRRFAAATAVLIHHELAIAWTVVAMIWLLGDGANQLGLLTLLLLWGMRISAKMNLFLGVSNFSDEFLPERLRYLSSYFAKRRMNALLPLSVLVGSGLAFWLLREATLPGATPFEVASFALLGTMAALATLEHLFLVLPVPDAALWRWLVRPNAKRPDGPVKLVAPAPESPGGKP